MKIEHIYCDFDGTITQTDTVNEFYKRFADKNWILSEEKWKKGEISSRENTITQLGLVKEVSPKDLFEFLDSIKIDNYFLDFISFIKRHDVGFTILSDGFDLFIEHTLRKYGLSHIDFYANHLIYKDNKFNIEFPYYNNDCKKGAGMCKCGKVLHKSFCYIGDGTSDLCVAKNADVLFATKSLHNYCVKNLITHYKFETFKEIKNILEEKL